jgi:PAS domain S-box-containing protein
MENGEADKEQGSNAGEREVGASEAHRDALLESEARFRALVMASSEVLYRMSADWSEMRQLSGRGFISDAASPQRDWIGKYIPSDEQGRVRAAIEGAVRSEGLFELEHRVCREDGSTGWVLSRAAPLVGPDGRITEWIGAANDITERKLVEESLRESEVRSRGLIETYAQAVWETDAAGMVVTDSPSWRDYTGQTFEEWIGCGWADAIHPEDRECAKRQWHEAVASRRPMNAECRLHHAASGGYRWTNVRAVPLADGDGAIRKWIGMNIDVHDRKLSQDALRESESRFRQFGEASSDVLWIRNAETLQWEYLSPAFEHIYGLSREETLSGNNLFQWTNLIVPEDRKYALDHISRVQAGERAVFEFRIQRPQDGGVRWMRNSVFPMTEQDGRIWRIGGIDQDITPLKESLHHQKLLLAELQHRIRNTIAVIRSIVRRTAENSEDVDDFVSHLDGRIDAYSRVQLAVSRDPLAGFDLGELIADELRACATHEGEQFTLDGPSVRLTPKAAESLGLAIHELATNAVKHGAFTVEGGRIDVSWQKQARGAEAWLSIDWKESGMTGRPIEQKRKGFGTLLLQQALQYDLGAQVTRRFDPHGFQCEIAFPLPQNTC